MMKITGQYREIRRQRREGCIEIFNQENHPEDDQDQTCRQSTAMSAQDISDILLRPEILGDCERTGIAASLLPVLQAR